MNTRPIHIALLAFFTGFTAAAHAQQTQEEPNNGEDFTRPPPNLDLRYQFEEKGGGTDQSTFILRSNRALPLEDGWSIATRLDVPFVLSNAPTGDNDDHHYGFGLGDVLLQAALIKEFPGRWAGGAGLRMVLPTASEDRFGAGKLRLEPLAGVRCSLPEISKGSFAQFQVRYDSDIAGDSSRSHISRLRWSPTLNVALPERWFVTFFPSQDIVYDFIGGKWFVPADAMIGKNLTDRTIISLEVSVPVIKQFDLYDFKLEARVTYKF